MERANLACSNDECYSVRFGTWNFDNVSGKACGEQRKRMVDLCCLQVVRWRGQGARILGMKGMRHKLWWFGKGDRVGGVGVMVKDGLC